MLQQKLQNRQPDALRGLGLIAAIAAAVLAGSAFFTRLQPRIGSMASLLFIAYGCAIAWFLLYWYAMGFVYTLAGDCLRVCRTYGRRERFVADVRFHQILAFGTPEEMKARYPGVRATEATRAQCPFEPFAIAYDEGGKTAILVLQPDDAIRARLTEAVKGR